MFSLKDKTAIVTGGNQGIGQAITEVLAEAGASVYFCGRSDAGHEVAKELQGRGATAHFENLDITREDDVKAWIAKIGEEAGRIDILVNNASYTSGAQHDILNADTDEWMNNVQVSLLGAHYCTQAALPLMIRQRSGSVIVISSIQALAGCENSTPYTTVKAGQLGFVLGGARDYGKHNIRFNAISPGPIQVAYSPKPGSPGYEYQVNSTMLGRVGQPREIAYAALYLAADESSFVTGTNLVVDGGWTAM